MYMFMFLLFMVHNLYMKFDHNKKIGYFTEPLDNIQGLDNRYPNTTNTDYDAMEYLQQNLEKLRLLRKLEKKRVSEMTKLMNIEHYNKNNTNSTWTVNLHSGDLFGDWNFEGF